MHNVQRTITKLNFQTFPPTSFSQCMYLFNIFPDPHFMLVKTMVITARNSSRGKVLFSQACVIPSVHRRGGVCLRRGLHPGGSMPMGGLHPGGGGVRIQRGESASRGVCLGGVCLWRSAYRGVCLGEIASRGWGVCIQEAGGLHPEDGGVGQTPPIGYHGIWQTSGRYASYWNAFLLK